MKKRFALLTGGGDCPGLNAVIRAITRKSLQRGHEIVGLYDGWKGLLEKNYEELSFKRVSGILHKGGTILRTSRTNVLKDQETINLAFKNFKDLKLDGLCAIGGEGTLTVTSKLFEMGMPVVGAPKTIDNDIDLTDFTFGFNTAVEIATEAIDRLHTTAESHNRVMVIEVMGRHAGWIASYSGIAGGADIILTPEKTRSLDDICKIIDERKKRQKLFSILVVAEGTTLEINGENISAHKSKKDPFGRNLLGGIGRVVADAIEEKTGIESRVTVLGHVQRGGSPSAHDRVLATRYGLFAADLLHEQKWGMMASIQGNKRSKVSLLDATKRLKTVPNEFLELTKSLEG